MPNGTPNNTGFFAKIIAFLKGNPIFAALAGLFMLALVLPPRKRKYRTIKAARRTASHKKSRRSPARSPGKRRKKRAGRKLLRVDGSIPIVSRKPKKRRSGTGKAIPARMVKGSAAAKAHMAHLRSLRKK